MKNLFLLCAFASLLFSIGCANVNSNTPHTTIKGSVAGQPFSIENPKDTVLEGLDVTAATNGTANIHITRLTTVMNPAVIDSTGTAGEKLVKAGSDAFNSGMQAGANFIGQTGGTVVKSAK